MFVSANGTRAPNAKQAMAPAVYAPTPGNASSASTLRGSPSGEARAIRCRSRARRL